MQKNTHHQFIISNGSTPSQSIITKTVVHINKFVQPFVFYHLHANHLSTYHSYQSFTCKISSLDCHKIREIKMFNFLTILFPFTWIFLDRVMRCESHIFGLVGFSTSIPGPSMNAMRSFILAHRVIYKYTSQKL